MAPQDPQAAALLAHVLTQIEQNVKFLSEQNYISQADASAILTRLPNQHNNVDGIIGIAGRFSNMPMPTPSLGARAVPSPPTPSAPSSAPTNSGLPTARALWAYNESGGDTDDLQFAVGDTIEIVEETNADWWTGRVNGRQGLFPSAYVEKIVQVGKSSRPYKPFGAAYHGLQSQQPQVPVQPHAPVPQPHQPMNNYHAGPPPPQPGAVAGPNSIGLSEKPGQQEKKDKLGGMKNTMAHSAVAGVGFGAGSAIGGGLVRAIF